MAKDAFSGLSSAFDELLAKSRREWDALAPAAGLAAPRTVPAPGGDSPLVPDAARNVGIPSHGAKDGAVLRRTGEYASAVRVWDLLKSEAAAFLFNRFGAEWQVEVAERRRDGDEFVVLVKLTVPGKNLIKSQFGRGRIPAAAPEPSIKGSAGGVEFSLGEAAGRPAQSPEERGYRRAIEDGLAKCVELL